MVIVAVIAFLSSRMGRGIERRALAGWLIAAWALMSAMVLAGIQYSLDHAT
jgi:TRAP-type mannitol/chloroaromatic compound transport system permease small subunit